VCLARPIIMGRAATLLRGQPTSTPPVEEAIIALVLGAAERARLRAGVKGRPVAVRFVDRIGELIDAVTREPLTIAAIVVEVRDADGRPTHAAVDALNAGGGGTPLVGYCRAGGEHSGDIRSLVLAGAHQLVFHGIDDTGIALRAILEAARQSSVSERANDAFMDCVPAKMAEFISFATRHPTTQRIAEIADALGYHRKTLVNRCAQAKLPPPYELLCWCRLAVAGELLASTRRTIESIALQLDFPSDTALRNMMKRYTGLKASEVRQRGGARCVVEVFRQAVDRSRERREMAG
jgi:AraC-like DNA-binding protein